MQLPSDKRIRPLVAIKLQDNIVLGKVDSLATNNNDASMVTHWIISNNISDENNSHDSLQLSKCLSCKYNKNTTLVKECRMQIVLNKIINIPFCKIISQKETMLIINMPICKIIDRLKNNTVAYQSMMHQNIYIEDERLTWIKKIISAEIAVQIYKVYDNNRSQKCVSF